MSDKQIRISADLSQLRSVKDEAQNLHRDMVDWMNDEIDLSQKAIEQLGEQLKLMEERNNLEKLFGELKKNNLSIQSPYIPQDNNQPREVSQDNIQSPREVSEEGARVNVDLSAVIQAIDEVNKNIVSGKKSTKGLSSLKTIIKRLDDSNKSLETIINILSNMEGSDSDNRITSSERSLDTIVNILSNIERVIVDNNGIVTPGITPPPPSNNQDEDNQPSDNESQNQRQRREDRNERSSNFVPRIIAGVGNMSIQNPISLTGSILSTGGGLLGEAAGMIPGIGGLLGGTITALGNVAATIITQTASRYLDAQRNVLPYVQATGVSNREANRVMMREGSYAATALGMTVDEYIARRGQLIKYAGGKMDVATVEDSQGLMAAERMYGIDRGLTNALQGAMRFATDENGQTRSASVMIRSFEETMKLLGKPLSEIASTMDESLRTFVKSADEILSKAGEIDASKISAVMSVVRTTTNAEGRQLERLQQAALGSGMSQDDVTQAYLLRYIQKARPELGNLSDIYAVRDTIGNNPELIQGLLADMRTTMPQELFRHMLKSMFPTLSYSDINKWSDSDYFSGKAAKDIQAKIFATRKENDEINQYEKSAAAETVSPAEAAMKVWENRMIGWGAHNWKYIFDINNGINELIKYFKSGDSRFEVDKNNPNQLNVVDEDFKRFLQRAANGEPVRTNGFSDVYLLFTKLVDKLDDAF